MNESTSLPLDTGLAAPVLRPSVDLWVDVDAPIEVGRIGVTTRRVVPIKGGRAVDIAGKWRARVLPGGADFQSIAVDGCASLQARYVLETDGGDRIYVENNAIRTGPPELIARLLRGEPVDPAAIYFRSTPRFEVAAPALRWMSERLFVGTGSRHPNQVVLRFFEVL